MSDIQDEACSEAMDEIGRLKALLIPAADALESLSPVWQRDLIAELRKAAQ